MLIRKIQQPAEYPNNAIYDAYNTSNNDTYSCHYVNGIANHLDETANKLSGTAGTILYDSESGTTGSVTLSEDASNYKWLEIQYYDYNNNYFAARAFPSKPSALFAYAVAPGTPAGYPKGNLITVSGNTITRDHSWEVEITTSVARYNPDTVNSDYTNFRIFRVIGFK